MTGFKPTTREVTLYQGDYQQRIEEAASAAALAEMRLKRAQEQSSAARSLDEVPDVVGLAEEFHDAAKAHDDLLAEAEAEGVLGVTLQALGRTEWSDVVAAHPPRTDESVPESVREDDAGVGVNEAEFGPALLRLSIVGLSNVKLGPEVDAEDKGAVIKALAPQVADLLEQISSAQYDLLYGTAFAINRGKGADPKARPRLLPSPSTPETAN